MGTIAKIVRCAKDFPTFAEADHKRGCSPNGRDVGEKIGSVLLDRSHTLGF